jgi:hypothetical protein
MGCDQPCQKHFPGECFEPMAFESTEPDWQPRALAAEAERARLNKVCSDLATELFQVQCAHGRASTRAQRAEARVKELDTEGTTLRSTIKYWKESSERLAASVRELQPLADLARKIGEARLAYDLSCVDSAAADTMGKVIAANAARQAASDHLNRLVLRAAAMAELTSREGSSG